MNGLALETNYTGYRNVEQSDIVPGGEVIMIDTDRRNGFDPTVDPEILGTRIRFDDPAIENEMVYYHCIDPKWDGQCFVPLKQFLGQEKALGTSDTTKYWIKK